MPAALPTAVHRSPPTVSGPDGSQIVRRAGVVRRRALELALESDRASTCIDLRHEAQRGTASCFRQPRWRSHELRRRRVSRAFGANGQRSVPCFSFSSPYGPRRTAAPRGVPLPCRRRTHQPSAGSAAVAALVAKGERDTAGAPAVAAHHCHTSNGSQTSARRARHDPATRLRHVGARRRIKDPAFRTRQPRHLRHRRQGYKDPSRSTNTTSVREVRKGPTTEGRSHDARPAAELSGSRSSSARRDERADRDVLDPAARYAVLLQAKSATVSNGPTRRLAIDICGLSHRWTASATCPSLSMPPTTRGSTPPRGREQAVA